MQEAEILEQQAVNAAMNLRWTDAVELNQKILKIDKNNVDAILRLAYANLQLHNLAESKKAYQRALKIQPKNQVAIENIERIDVLAISNHKKNPLGQTSLDLNLFLEIPGKTKSASLVNLGQKSDLAKLAVGQKVELKQKKRKVEVRTVSGDYIGSLPDDLSKRLLSFIKAKSAYQAHVKESNLNRIVIFIREEKKGKKVAQFSSFPANIQANLDRLSQNANSENEEETDVEEDEWEKITTELVEEKDENLVHIDQEEEEEE